MMDQVEIIDIFSNIYMLNSPHAGFVALRASRDLLFLIHRPHEASPLNIPLGCQLSFINFIGYASWGSFVTGVRGKFFYKPIFVRGIWSPNNCKFKQVASTISPNEINFEIEFHNHFTQKAHCSSVTNMGRQFPASCFLSPESR